LTQLVERMGAELSGATRRNTREGLPYAQDRKCKKARACSWAAWKMDWRDALLNAFRERSR
jgi:hypothetical protein